VREGTREHARVRESAAVRDGKSEVSGNRRSAVRGRARLVTPEDGPPAGTNPRRKNNVPPIKRRGLASGVDRVFISPLKRRRVLARVRTCKCTPSSIDARIASPPARTRDLNRCYTRRRPLRVRGRRSSSPMPGRPRTWERAQRFRPTGRCPRPATGVSPSARTEVACQPPPSS